MPAGRDRESLGRPCLDVFDQLSLACAGGPEQEERQEWCLIRVAGELQPLAALGLLIISPQRTKKRGCSASLAGN
jgi:hypothetical protein